MKKISRTMGALALCLILCLLLGGCTPTQRDLDAQSSATPLAQTEAKTTVLADDTTVAASDTLQPWGTLVDYSAVTMEGKTFGKDEVGGRDVTLINFWSVTCGPCVREMPDLARLQKALPDNGQLITACLDGESGRSQAEKILSNAGYEGITLLSLEGDLAGLASSVMYIPTTVAVDGAGQLIGDPIIGGQTELEAVFLSLINEVLHAADKAEIALNG